MRRPHFEIIAHPKGNAAYVHTCIELYYREFLEGLPIEHSNDEELFASHIKCLVWGVLYIEGLLNYKLYRFTKSRLAKFADAYWDLAKQSRIQDKLTLILSLDQVGWAIASGRFGSVECSVNPFDQRSLMNDLAIPATAGLGVIGKRSLGNAPWRIAHRTAGDYCEVYWGSLKALAFDTLGLPWDEFALRFSAFAPNVGSAIVGTASLDHLRHNVRIAERGPCPPTRLAQ